MRAVRWHGRGDLRLDDIAEPGEPGPREAIVEVSFCGVCGTDLGEVSEGPIMIRPEPHPLTGSQPPMTLGHEFAGRIRSLGSEVEGLETGSRVAVDPCWRCGRCAWCLRGEYELCKLGGSVGLASDGALAGLVRVPIEGLAQVPDGVSDELAALAEPLAVGVHAVRQGGVAAGDRVLVLGAGPVGAAVVLAAVASGASAVYVSDPLEERRTLALELGADEAFDPGACDVRREVYLRTGRVGSDVVFDCTGRPDQLEAAVNAARRGGHVVLVGVPKEPSTLDGRRLLFYGRRITGSLGYRFDIPRVLELMAAGRLDPGPLITRVVSLDEATDVIASLAQGAGEAMKVLVEVGGTHR